MTEIVLLLSLVLLVTFAAAGLVWPTIAALIVLTVCLVIVVERPAGDPS